MIVCLDSIYALTSKNSTNNPLLGTGGNDGNAEFINIFMENLIDVFKDKNRSEEWINASLFGGQCKMIERVMGQFNPGLQFSANMTTTDTDGTSLINPWDYILMIEGCMLFSGGVTRRLSAESTSLASFPFVTEHVMAGDATSAYAEIEKKEKNEKPRGEIWIPIWNKVVNFNEIQHVFYEGRAEIGGKHVRNGSDFARAIINLGTEKGISEFHRFVIRRRNGRSFIMMNAGKFVVMKRR